MGEAEGRRVLEKIQGVIDQRLRASARLCAVDTPVEFVEWVKEPRSKPA